jgi:hypothetical protein
VKVIRDKAASIQHYIKQRDGSLESQNLAAELKIRAERKLGALLAETVNHTGGGNRKSRSHDVTPISDLPDDVSKMESHRWQQIAAIPEPVFEQTVSDVKDKGELTTAGMLRLAKAAKKEAAPREPRAPTAAEPVDVSRRRCAGRSRSSR